jgi:hypothetical protein
MPRGCTTWRPWTPAEVEEGRRLRACGVTCPEIARLLKRTLKAVQDKLRTSRMGRPRADLWEWRLLLSLGLPDAEIARRKGCGLSNVRYFRQRCRLEGVADASVGSVPPANGS